MRNEEEGFYRAFEGAADNRDVMIPNITQLKLTRWGGGGGETKRIDAILAPPEYNFKQAQPAKYNVLPDFQYLHLEHCPTIR